MNDVELTRKQKDQWLDEKDKRESLNSLWYFGRFVLGFDFEINPHKEICDFVQDAFERFKIILLPRGTFKTSIVSQVLPIWILIKEPNARILLDSEVLKNSERNLGVIKRILEGNKRFRYLFGDWVDKDHWTQTEITVKQRTNINLREPSIGASSLDTIEIGPHWDYIFPDDLHSADNSKTKDQIEQVYEHFRLLFSLLEPNGVVRLVGTRWNDLDTYGIILENHKEFKALVRQAVQKDGTAYFPSRFPIEILEGIRKVQGIDLFSSQYLNDPVPQGESASFRREWFQYGTNKDIPLYITVDPSISASADADYFAIAIGGLSRDNALFIEGYSLGHFQPYDAIDKIFRIYDAYPGRVKGIGIETNAFQKMFKFAFEVEMRKRNKFIKIYELHHSKSKAERILALQPRYESRSVFHNPWMRNGELEEELLKFPRGRRDDVADAVASLLEIVVPRSKHKTRTQTVEIPDSDSKVESYIRYHIANRRFKNRAPIHPFLGSHY